MIFSFSPRADLPTSLNGVSGFNFFCHYALDDLGKFTLLLENLLGLGPEIVETGFGPVIVGCEDVEVFRVRDAVAVSDTKTKQPQRGTYFQSTEGKCLRCEGGSVYRQLWAHISDLSQSL